MPKAMQYTKGSIIYFSGDRDDRIFILQQGLIVLTSTDIETGSPQTEHVKRGEFFGVKSALGHFPREETATVIADSIAIILTVAEFEKTFSENKAVIMKMLRVFSNQLRAIHRKTESILNSNAGFDQPTGMLLVAQSFLEDEQYQACCDVCMKLLSRFPNASNKEATAKLYTNTKRKLDMQKQRGGNQRQQIAAQDAETAQTDAGALKQFSLPAFSRFAKTFEAGSVIIAEYESGDSFYLIQSGSVQLVKCVKGAKKNLDILRPSEFFGEMAILENSPRSATAVAVNTVKVLEFNKENFEILITGNPQIALILLKLFCKRIYDQKRRLKILVIEDTQARIADVFLMFAEMQPNADPNERTMRFNLTIQDISHWAGLPVDTVRDEVNRFVEKHKIEVYDTYIVVNNIVDMRRIVDTRAAIRSV
ncbi:Crp/Fnr family transcriptional regulator [Treponema sp.]|uniref:Crp/Fnr family transcriptional regulator n=1 Tax=Treponema sp. TaxID=166 RepID=UPI003FA1F671